MIGHTRSATMSGGASVSSAHGRDQGGRPSRAPERRHPRAPKHDEEELVLSAFGFDDPPTAALEFLTLAGHGHVDAWNPADDQQQSDTDYGANDAASLEGRSDSETVGIAGPLRGSPKGKAASRRIDSGERDELVASSPRLPPLGLGGEFVKGTRAADGEPLLPLGLLRGLPKSILRELGPEYAR